ncbi:hypothetical protein OC835_002836 [Tilletia horrida]|nr:hypothetical protein OC835_002836 [Tilletia horrida]
MADISLSSLAAAAGPTGGAAGASANGTAHPDPSAAANGNGEVQEDLWSSILNSVQSTRAVPTKNVLILGESSTGKSTLLHFLAERSSASYINTSSSVSAALSNNKGASPQLEQGGDSVLDLGLSYGYWDAGDEDGDVVARIGAYQLSSSHPTYRSLLPFSFPAPSLSASAGGTSESGPTLPALLGGTSGPSSAPAPSPAAMLDTCIIITLDWSQPWTFLSQLRTWMETIRALVVAAEGKDLGREVREADAPTAKRWRAAEIALEEMREKLEAFLRTYVEPGSNVLALSADSTNAADGTAGIDTVSAAADGSTITVPAASSLAYDKEAQLPLGDGILTNNYGVPIIVVCTKADLMGKLERDRDFKEEQFDYIQQVLRTVCLKYGAALFYTSHTRPQSFDVLRSYVLHRLFPPLPATGAAAAASAEANGARPGIGGTSTSTNAGAGASGAAATAISFPFNHRAATLAERETLLVPTGWDSWGKINALREGFDCKGWGLGWDFDCEVERRRRLRQSKARAAAAAAAASKAAAAGGAGGEGAANGTLVVPNGLTAPGLSRSGNTSEQGSNTPRAQQAEEAEIEKEVELDIRPEDRGVGSAVRLYEDIVSDVEGNLAHHAPTPAVRSPDDQEFLQQWYATLATKKDDGPGGAASSSSAAAAALTGGSGSGSAAAAAAAAALAASSGLGGSGGAGGGLGRDSPRPMSPGISEYLQNATGGGRGGLGAGAGATGSPMAGSRSNTRQSEVLHSFFQSLLEGTDSGGGAGRRGGLTRGARAGTPGAGGAGSGAGGNTSTSTNGGNNDGA